MPLWLDLLRTPMAAPETRSLRLMRYIWQLLCLSCAAGAGFFPFLKSVFGRGAPIGLALLLIATLLITVIYLLRKHRADSAHLETMGAGEC